MKYLGRCLSFLLPSKPLPELKLVVQQAFVNGSFVAPNAWYRAEGWIPGGVSRVCKLSFGVSPLLDRIYVDELAVKAGHLRKGYASAILLAVAQHASPAGTLLPVTALHELWTSHGFWDRLRQGRVPGLMLTQDLRVGDMEKEARRWKGHDQMGGRAG